MTEKGDVVFDAKSGISIEEQKEILSQINGIAEKNRRSLSQDAGLAKEGGKKRSGPVDAKKTGAFFPLAVNIAAALVLLGGAFLLVLFNSREDARVRMGTAVLNLTERKVIEDIRRDTAEKIRAKDLEISSMTSRLEEVDAQLALLSSGNQVLSAQQLQTQETLLSTQNIYRAELAVLQDERAQILENSRSQEASLRAQIEQRAVESSADRQSSSAAGELERLTDEQEKIAAIEAYLAGGLDAITGMVQNGEYDQAAQTVENLVLFINRYSLASSFSFASSIWPRVEFYNRMLAFLETVIAASSGKGGAAQSVQVSQDSSSQEQELAAKNAELEKTIASLRSTIDSLDSGSASQAGRLAGLEESVSTLRAQVSSLETSAAEKDRTISSLTSENAALQSANTTQEQEITSLRNQLAIIRQALQE